MNPLTNPPSPTVARKAPSQSVGPASLLRLSGIFQTEIAITAAAKRKIDEKYPAPGGMLNQPSAENRPNRRR